jgi:hypothetical protein
MCAFLRHNIVVETFRAYTEYVDAYVPILFHAKHNWLYVRNVCAKLARLHMFEITLVQHRSHMSKNDRNLLHLFVNVNAFPYPFVG